MDIRPADLKQLRTRNELGPTAGFATLCEEIDQLFEELALPGHITCVPQAPAGAMLMPPVELTEMPDHYDLAIELPGLERKDITVEFAGGVLAVTGEKRAQWGDQSGDCLISERSYGAFQRRFSLPQDVAPDQIVARYRHGVLTVTIGKDASAESRVRAIAVT